MVFVVKYFRRNQFQKKLFSRKYFSAFGSHKKITKRENTSVAIIRQQPDSGEHVWSKPAKMARFRQDSSGSCQIRTNPGHFGQIRLDPVRSGRIPAILARSGQINGRV
jgi:hypothetical protein